MTGMVHLTVAGDVTEAEEMQDLLAAAGIAATLEAHDSDPSLTVLVPEGQLDEAKDAIEALTEPDELVGE